MRKLILSAFLFVACIGKVNSFEQAKDEPLPSELFHPVIQDFEVDPSLTPRAQPKVIKPPVVVENLTPPTPKPQNKKQEEPPKVATTSVAAAKRYALDRLGSTQYSCIDKIFTRESNWRTFARNSSSGAYGIPQALPGSKMAVIADDWRTNPITQVRWGIRYVNGRYGSACAAWRFHQNNGWY